jgi:hypothetical protein
MKTDGKPVKAPEDVTPDPTKPVVVDRELLDEARERFALAETAASDNRRRFTDAIRFLSGEQWDPALKRMRESGPNPRPCLTMDRLTTHVNLVVNAQRQNKPAVKVHPVDNTGDIKVAEIYDGVIRHIEAVSNADTAYETAGFTQSAAGVGYWRVLTQFKDETAFEQEIVIGRITNPLSVYFDPDAREMDGSDAHWCFIVDSMDRKRFEERYGKEKTEDWEGVDDKGWWDGEKVRTAEYFRVLHKLETLYLFDDGTAMFDTDYKTSIANGGDPRNIVKQRKGRRRVVEWFKLGGDSIIDSRIWPGRWIPVVRVVGNEIDVEGDLQYTGIVHRAMDAQRAYNYWVSKVTETVSSAANAPYIGVKGQFQGVEAQWRNANTNNPAYLEVNAIDVNGNPAPMPHREAPISIPTGAVNLVQMMADDMRWITGQQEANFGAPSNEQSGRAIIARQQQGDTATYHYVDNLARGIRHTGRIIVDMVPRVLDVKQILRTLGEDGSSDYAEHDPDQAEAIQKQQLENGEIHRIYNLGVGRYDVEVSVGPNFTTRRLEAVDAFQALIQANPDLMNIFGDIYLRNQDWPGAQDAADRFAKTIDPKLKGSADGDDDPEVQMQQAMGQAQQQIQELTAKVDTAQQLTDGADKEIAELKQKLEQAEFKANDKSTTAQIQAEAARYAEDCKERIADKQIAKDLEVAAMNNGLDQIAELQQVVSAIAHFVGVTPPEPEQVMQ